MMGWIFLGLIVAAVFLAISIYNRLVAGRNRFKNAFAQIDVQLTRRHDLIPNLVETAKGYMKHERETLERVIELRNQCMDDHGSVSHQEGTEKQLVGAMQKLLAVAEAYPDLKADQSFQHLQSRITGLENAIADRREFYNEAVNLNNVRIEQFPDVVIAKKFNFKPFELLEFSDEEKKDVDIKGLFQ